MNQYTKRHAERRLERKLAAPVSCENCHWNGKTGDLFGRSEVDGAPFSCPRCDKGMYLVWIERPTTETLQ